MIMKTLLSNKNLSIKTTMDLIKLSTRFFHGRMRESGSKMCRIKRLNGTSIRIRFTFLLKNT
jgi:hypothetical protein